MSLSNDMGFVIRSHLLAASIIARQHNPDTRIFDDSELDLLQEFCANPTKREEILVKHDMVDESGTPAGSRAQKTGSLAGFCIARHGTDNPALQEAEIEMLRNWFHRGGAGDRGAKL